jgi:recombination protein RecA
MLPAIILRHQIEASLAHRIPSALTPRVRTIRPVAPTGIQVVDELLDGGLPLGAITEVVGPVCSGRTTFALSFLAAMTRARKVCAWIDVSDEFDPESAASAGVELANLLWIRCGVRPASQAACFSKPGFSLQEKYFAPPPIKKGLHGGGFGPHPRNEAKDLSDAISRLLRPEGPAFHQADPQYGSPTGRTDCEQSLPLAATGQHDAPITNNKQWARIDRALRVADLLLQGGGFGAIVLDMGSIAPEHVIRVPLATWFRYRAAAERTQTSILLLTQHPCAKSSAELLLRLRRSNVLHDSGAVLGGFEHCLKVARRRFTQAAMDTVPLRRYLQNESSANWSCGTMWTGPR